MIRRTSFALLLAAASAAMPCAAAQAACTAPGSRVELASDAVDPDVFLWDSRERLVGYAAGQWGSTKQIFDHTLLAMPGTMALVVSCVSSVAHPRYSAVDEDAVGVKVLTGRYRGRYGWVLSSDVHPVR